MAGIRQHYLPQFLQRPFADADGLTWLFRKHQPGRRASTRDIGVEKKFYTSSDDTSVDDSITAVEAEFSSMVNELRGGSPRTVSNALVPRLFAHLEVRSRHLRRTFQQMSESLYRKTVPILSDQEKLTTLLTRHIAENPEEFAQLVRRTLREKGLPDSSANDLAAAVRDSLPSRLQDLMPELEQATHGILESLDTTLATSIKESHNNALRKAIAPEQRVQSYQGLTFRLCDLGEETMILGDCACIFHVAGTKAFKPLSEAKDAVVAAILPLGPRRLLIGELNDFELDVSTVRTAMARCSSEFFISVDNSEKNAALAKLIALDATPLTDSELDDIVNQVTN